MRGTTCKKRVGGLLICFPGIQGPFSFSRSSSSKVVAMGKKAKSNAAPAKERQVQAPPSVELLEDIVIRFILNAPDEEKAAWQRLLFLVEQAHWFYEDYYAANNPESLLSYNLRDFVALVFTSVTLLQPYTAFLDPIYKTFVGYKQSVPVCGCIILNSTLTHVLLVKGWKSQSPWGFPKGKINRNEEPSACAAREVWEETGFDVTPYIEEESSLEFTFRQKNEQLFIITGIDERTAMFQPQANKEISAIEWYPVASLPDAGAAGEKDSAHSFGAMKSTGKDGSKFYMVWPFVKRLRKWIKQRKRGGSSGGVASGKEEEEEYPCYLRLKPWTRRARVYLLPACAPWWPCSSHVPKPAILDLGNITMSGTISI